MQLYESSNKKDPKVLSTQPTVVKHFLEIL